MNKNTREVGLSQNLVEDELLTGKQVASMFQICAHTLRRWVRRGLLQPVRINTRVLRYPRSQVERLLQQAA